MVAAGEALHQVASNPKGLMEEWKEYFADPESVKRARMENTRVAVEGIREMLSALGAGGADQARGRAFGPAHAVAPELFDASPIRNPRAGGAPGAGAVNGEVTLRIKDETGRARLEESRASSGKIVVRIDYDPDVGAAMVPAP